MIINAAARHEDVGVQPRRAATVQLTAGRKQGGKIVPATVHRFWLVHTSAKGGKAGSKLPHFQYPVFNQEIDWKDPAHVALRTTFYGVLRHAAIEDNGDLSFFAHRGKGGAALGTEKANPKGNRFKCRCDGRKAQRWNGKLEEYQEIELPGGRTCPCFMSGEAKRTLRVWFQPSWQNGCGWPVSLTLWVTRARRTIDSFYGMIQDVEKFASSNRIDLSLVGLPFELQWGRRKGDGTDYPDISVSFRGDIAAWAGWQQQTINQLGGSPQRLLTTGPGMEATEHEPDAVCEDVAAIIETRPAAVAVPKEAEPDKSTEPPGALMIRDFLGYMPTNTEKRASATECKQLLREASCITAEQNWYDLDENAPAEVWQLALEPMKEKP